jgi:hypothetical protein
MRILLLVLVLGNLALYGWTQGWIVAPGESRAAARHERQVNAGMLTVEPALTQPQPQLQPQPQPQLQPQPAIER